LLLLINMVGIEQAVIGIENKPTSDSTQQAVNTTLDKLLDKYATPRHRPFGRGRGSVLPIGSAVGTAAAQKTAEILLKLEASPIARVIGSLSVGMAGGVAATEGLELALKAAPVVLGVPGVVMAAAASAGSTLLVSAVERGLGENTFQMFAKYSHIEGVKNSRLVKATKLAAPPVSLALEGLGKGYQIFTRSAERLALQQISSPIKLNHKVRKLVALSEKDSADFSKKNLKLVSEGFYYLLTTRATEKFGAYLSPKEKALMAENISKVSGAIDKVLAQSSFSGQIDSQTLFETIGKTVDQLETRKYWEGVAALTGIEAVKGAMLYQILDLTIKLVDNIKQGVFPLLPGRKLNTNPILKPQLEPVPILIEEPAKVPVTMPDLPPVSEPVLQPGLSSKPSPSLFPWKFPNNKQIPQGESIPVPVITQPVIATEPVVINPIPVLSSETVIEPVQTFTVLPTNETVPVVSTGPKLEVVPVVPAAKAPEISSSILAGIETMPIQTIIQSPQFNLQYQALMAMEPQIRERALIDALGQEVGPAIVTAFQAGVPQTIEALNSVDPATVRLFFKLLFAIPSGGMSLTTP